MSEILVLYFSRDGAVKKMAQLIARGIESVEGMQARIRTVPEISDNLEAKQARVPDHGSPFVTLDDLTECAGLALGSPAYFGNMAAPLKYFFDQTTPAWITGKLSGKPAALFTASSTHHGGQETTLQNMMVPLLHHGMIILGLPYSEAALENTSMGGTPYGASHISGLGHQNEIDADEKALCLALGKRLAVTATKLGSK
jgi:NAD(P)H dehydrogenase (quinone)